MIVSGANTSDFAFRVGWPNTYRAPHCPVNSVAATRPVRINPEQSPIPVAAPPSGLLVKSPDTLDQSSSPLHPYSGLPMDVPLLVFQIRVVEYM